MINKTRTQKGFKIITRLVALLIACIFVFAGWYVWQSNRELQEAINTFEACVAAGNPIMESYPEQCSANGKIFIKSK